MVSYKRALEVAAEIRARGKNARVVFVTKGLGPGVSTYMVESSPKKQGKADILSEDPLANLNVWKW